MKTLLIIDANLGQARAYMARHKAVLCIRRFFRSD